MNIFSICVVLSAILSVCAQAEDLSDTTNSTLAEEQSEQIIYSCILLSRYQLSSYGDQLVQIVKSQDNSEEKTQVWKKMYAGHVQHCLSKIDHEQSLEVVSDVANSKFDLKNYFKLFSGFDLNIFKQGRWSKEIIAQEEALWKLIQDLESSLAERKQEKKQQALKAQKNDL